jgi:hypothetical protein
MDPYIEGQEWEDFHTEVISAIRAQLVPLLRPRYEVRVEKRAYLEHTPPDGIRVGIRLDAGVVRDEPQQPLGGGTATAVVAAIKPVVLALPIPERRHEYFITIRDMVGREVVTAIEILSPSNKRRGSDGRRKYLRKREAVLLSAAHLVEIDLVRGGERLPAAEPLPPADYYAFVSREERRPHAEVYCWTLRHALPTIPIPLAGNDPDVPLDLQAALTTAYDRAGYDYSLDYEGEVVPPLSEKDAAWAREILQGKVDGSGTENV